MCQGLSVDGIKLCIVHIWRTLTWHAEYGQVPMKDALMKCVRLLDMSVPLYLQVCLDDMYAASTIHPRQHNGLPSC
jgi:hypothetical protein